MSRSSAWPAFLPPIPNGWQGGPPDRSSSFLTVLQSNVTHVLQGSPISKKAWPRAFLLLRNPARRKTQFLPALFIQRVALLSGAWSQGSARHDRQWRQLPISPLRQGYACSKSSTCVPSPIRRKPMARLSGSFKPHCGNGPTLGPTKPQTKGLSICRNGFTDIIGTDPTAA